jgi:hypothetical protein
MPDEQRKTIAVTNTLGRPIALHPHMIVKDDGAGRASFGRLLHEGVILQPGINTVDEEFFQEWKKQNPGFGLLSHITTEADDKPESAKREE